MLLVFTEHMHSIYWVFWSETGVMVLHLHLIDVINVNCSLAQYELVAIVMKFSRS